MDEEKGDHQPSSLWVGLKVGEAATVGLFIACVCRYYGAVISEFDSQSRKHTILKEDGEYEILDLSLEEWDLLDELP